METAEVTLTPEQQAAADATAATAAELEAAKNEAAALKTQLAEKDEAVRYWHSQARGKTAEPKADAAAATDDDPDMLDLIGSKDGGKKLTEYLAKKGFVSGEEVDKRVNERAGQLTREAQLVKDFPDLLDDKSDFFKATASEYGVLIKAGVPQGKAMELAAKNVRLAQLEAGDGGDPKPKADPEKDRQRRIAAQSGDKGRRTAASEDADTVSADDRDIWSRMGITEAEGLAARKDLGHTSRRAGGR